MRPFMLDGRPVTTKAQLLAALASAGEFPGWFGHNWDAAADCLADLSWAPTNRGYLLVYDGWGMLARTEPDAWTATIRVLEDSCTHWAATPTPFAVVLRGPRPDDDLTTLD